MNPIEPHVCLDRDGYPRTDDDGQPLTPERYYCGACDSQWCNRCDPSHGPLCPFCDHGSSTATLKLPTERVTLEACTCGECYDCPDGWHDDDEMPCSCTPDCALTGDEGRPE